MRHSYGYLFPELLPQDSTNVESIIKLMSTSDKKEESTVPLGYVFFGQFIDHDITLDNSDEFISDHQFQLDQVKILTNRRNPRFDLDSVFGLGPELNGYLYDSDGFLIVETDDLTRNESGIAIIPDHRNDENPIIAQLHLAIQKYYNLVHKQTLKDSDDKSTKNELIEKSITRTRWQYQYIVLNDYLPTIVGNRIINDIRPNSFDTNFLLMKNNRNFSIPLEFSGAAFRFGHSQVPESLSINSDLADLNIFDPKLRTSPIDWRMFFDIEKEVTAQKAMRVQPFLSKSMLNIPRGLNLVKLNIHKGLFFKLPSGQDLARAANLIPEPSQYPYGDPLWYYILKETKEEGSQLGALGSRIVAEVIIRLIHEDEASYLNQGVNWTPTHFSISEMLNSVN